jgi:hypothetical protein
VIEEEGRREEAETGGFEEVESEKKAWSKRFKSHPFLS